MAETRTTAEIFDAGGTGQADAVIETINQTAHGLTALSAVYHNGTSWLPASSSTGDSVAIGIVTEVTDVDNFTVTTHGVATVTAHGLTVGQYYWLSDASGVISDTVDADIAQSLLHVRDANTLFVDTGQAIATESSTSINEALDWMYVALSADTSTTQDGTAFPIPFDTVRRSYNSTNLTLNANGSITLGANKRYRVSSLVITGNEENLAYWDMTNDVQLHDQYNNNDSTNSHGSYETIIETTAPIAVGVVTNATATAQGGSFALNGATNDSVSWMLVEELPSTTVFQSTALPTAPQSNWNEGDMGVWNSTTQMFEPSPISDNLDAITDFTCSVGFSSTGPVAPGTGNVVMYQASYYQIGKYRYYTARVAFDLDSAFTISVTGASQLYGFAVVDSTVGEGSFNQIGITAANEITFDRLNTVNDDVFTRFTFVAEMA